MIFSAKGSSFHVFSSRTGSRAPQRKTNKGISIIKATAANNGRGWCSEHSSKNLSQYIWNTCMPSRERKSVLRLSLLISVVSYPLHRRVAASVTENLTLNSTWRRKVRLLSLSICPGSLDSGRAWRTWKFNWWSRWVSRSPGRNPRGVKESLYTP